MTSNSDDTRERTPGQIHDVLQVNTSDLSGGAERVSLLLHRQFAALGLRSALAVGWKHTTEPGVVEIPNATHRSAWAQLVGSTRRADMIGTLARALGEPARYWMRLRGHEDFCFPATPHIAELSAFRPQVLHLHNMHGGFFDIRALPALSHQYPTVLTVHDAWALTGHCAHPMECERWRSGCGECPDLERFVPIMRDASAANWRTKHDALRRSRLFVASPSKWLLDIVLAADLGDAIQESRVIPNGVDVAVFHPGDKLIDRRACNLPTDRAIVVTAARANAANDYKGAAVLHDALAAASDSLNAASDVLVLTLGDTAPHRRIGRFELRSVPFTARPDEVAAYLRAADVYVHPSRAENYPLAVLEALACGTPVIVSSAGGTPEVVADSRAALLFESGDPQGLAAHLGTLLSDTRTLEEMGARARADAPRCYTIQQQAAAYVQWYGEILGR